MQKDVKGRNKKLDEKRDKSNNNNTKNDHKT
jgi:hypothetical protein